MAWLVLAGTPDMPELYTGYATINGVLAPNGTFIEVRVNGTNESVGNTTINVSDGSYMLIVYFDINETNETDEGAVSGDLLVWFVNGSQAERPVPANDTANPGGVNDLFVVSVGVTPLKIVDYSPSSSTPVVNENSNITFTVTAIGPVNSNLTYNWTVNGATQSNSTSLVYNSSIGENGTKNITVGVSNGTSMDIVSWNLTININPVVSPNVPDVNVTGNSIKDVDLTPYETDYEDSGTNLYWNTTNVDSYYLTTYVDTTTDVLTLIPRAYRAGSTNITLQLFDSDGGMDSQNITINIEPPCSGSMPLKYGDWNVTSNTSCANTNITLSGNANLNVFGNVTLTFDNVTLILDNGTLTAYDGGNADSVIQSIINTIIDWIT